MVVYLETERLTLRRFTPDDLDDLVALDSDPAVMRYINGGRPTPHDEMRDDYLPWWLAYYDRGDAWGFWAAIERETLGHRRTPPGGQGDITFRGQLLDRKRDGVARHIERLREMAA